MLSALSGIGVDFSVPESDIRHWIVNSEFTPYPAIAISLIQQLMTRRLRNPVFLDVIVFNYEQTPGMLSPRKASDVDIRALKAAVVQGYNVRYGEAFVDFELLVQ